MIRNASDIVSNVKPNRGILFGILLAAACSEPPSSPAGPDVGRVDVEPATLTLHAGEVRVLAARATGRDGSALDVHFTWSSGASSIATVETGGVLHALRPGTTVVRASVGGVNGEATVEVLPAAAPVLPQDWQMEPGQRVALRAALGGTVTWRVDGVPGGDAGRGTITPEGVYTAPSAIPAAGVVTITAAGPDGTASTSIRIVAGDAMPSDLDRMLWTPRVWDAASGGDVRIRVRATGHPDRVVLAPRAAPILEALPVATDTWEIVVPETLLRASSTEGAAHVFVGFIDFFDGAQVTTRFNGFANVRTADMPAIVPTRLADDAQSGPHVLNLRVDAFVPGQPVDPRVLRRMYALLPDAFDFVAVIEPATAQRNRNYTPVSNDTRGIGLRLFSDASQYGSDGRLQGVIQFPILSFFDLAEPGALHEIGHRWINFLDMPPFADGVPHWPIADFAYGIMGFSIGGRNGQGGSFPFEIVPFGDDAYRLASREPARTFNDVELYMMGLLPADSVGEHIAFETPLTEPPRDGTILRGPVVPIDGAALQTLAGVREPAWPQAPRAFRIATVVLSEGRLLSASELAFVDHMAARAGAREPLPFTSGFLAGTTLPFFLATGGRATLDPALDAR